MTTPEGRVKAKVNKLLKNYEPFVYRFMPVQRGMGKPALDYYNCGNGWFFAVETKRGPNVKITPQQIETMNHVLAAGGEIFVIYDDESLNDLKVALEDRLTDNLAIGDQLDVFEDNPAWAVRARLQRLSAPPSSLQRYEPRD